MILKFLLEKEFKLIKRNAVIPRLIIIMPLMMMILMPFAANLEIRNIYLAIVDNDRTTISRQFIDKILSSTYFKLAEVAPSYNQAMEGIEDGSADIILEIPRHFGRNISSPDTNATQRARILISANSVNANMGAMGSSYITAIAQEFVASQFSDKGVVVRPEIEVVPQNRFNPTLNYRYFMVPALMVMLLTIMCGFLPALNIVGEKESGTIEQMNVSPVSKLTFIASKLLPYWIIGFVVLSLCFVLAWAIYGLRPVGNLLTIYAAATLFLLTVSGMGLVISNYSQTMQQSMFVMFFFLLILILLSGLFTPVNSMPEWAQTVTYFNPLTYFIRVMRGVYLKGSTIVDIMPQLGALAIFGTMMNIWAIISYHKNTK